MKIQTIFSMQSPYRDDFRIRAYTFGQGEKSLCIVGSMRGDEIQQQYIASRMVALLQEAETKGRIPEGISISVIPSANPFSINIEKRFWALDGTDINRMFPGYDQGETTQRIAAGLFEYIKDFRYGIQLASFYLPGNFLPHIRMEHTGFEDVEDARLFGFPFIEVHTPEPFDTVLLNYNWQIWETQAFSLYAGSTDVIDHPMAEVAIEGICRFVSSKGLCQLSDRTSLGHSYDIEHSDRQEEAPETQVITSDQLISLQAPHAGILIVEASAGQHIQQGQRIAYIMHPYEGRTVAEIHAPTAGTIFFARNKSITFQNTLLFRIIAD